MTTLQTLLRVFAQLILKIAALYMVVSFVGILALDRLFGGYEFYLGMLVFIGPLLAWGLTFMLVPKNLDWILALPISKRNVLVLNYVTSIFTSVVIMIASLVVLVSLAVIKSDVHVDMSQVARSAPAKVLPHDQLGPLLAGIDIYGWMTGFLMISFFHALSMSISRPATTKRLYLNLWFDSNRVVRWLVRVGWLGAVALGAVFREYVLSPFGVFLLAVTVFLLVTTFNTSHALGVGRVQRRRWLAISGCVAVSQIVFLFAHALQGTHAQSFDRRVASVMFLGPLSGGLAREDVARLLEGDINAERIAELGDLYRKRFWGGRKVRSSEERELNFFRAIESKKTFGDVVAMSKVFDPADLEAAGVRALFAKLRSLAPESRGEYAGYELLGAQLEAEDVLDLLATAPSGKDSRDDGAVQFSLLWARYRAVAGDRRFIAAIEKGMPQFSDRAKLSALLTLSVLEGRRYGLNDWLTRSRGGRAVSSSRFDVDCASWSPKSIAELTAADAPALNYCLRRRAEPVTAPEIEAAGWLEPPYDPKAHAAIRKVLRLK